MASSQPFRITTWKGFWILQGVVEKQFSLNAVKINLSKSRSDAQENFATPNLCAYLDFCN